MTTSNDIDPFLDRWLTDGPTGVPDGVLSTVMDRIASTPQRGRTRAPWRYLEMSSALRIITAAILVASGAGLLFGGARLGPSQPGGAPALVASPSPSPISTAAPSPAAEVGYAAVTATSDCGETIEEGTSQMGSLPYGATGLVLGCDNSASDPRVSGPGTMTLNIETWDPTVKYAPGTNMVLWGDVLIDGPEGSWSGRQYGIYDSEGTVHVFGVLAGSGAYEGWSYATSATVPGPTGNTHGESVGVIYHGSPPPGYLVEPFPVPSASPAP